MTIENPSAPSSLMDDGIIIDRRRIDLFNDPNYGIVLCFLEKYRSSLDLPHYPLQLFEDHLLRYQEQIPPRLIDFHFTLLKRISLAKNAQRDKFDSIITRFAARFDANDSEYLSTTGYLQSDIQIKIRILKNLLESQFDLNQTFRNTLNDRSSTEIKSLPIGRDRLGVSYWFFVDEHCFVRLFREDVDIDRTWTIVAKDRNELEKFIGLLITDATVRRKFSDWTITCEPFSSLSPSDEFEQRYSSVPIGVTEKEIETSVLSGKRKRGRPRGSGKVQIITRSAENKGSFDPDQSEDDISLAVRCSTRFPKTSILEPVVKTKPPASNRKKKRRRKSSSTSEDFDFDDYLSDPSPLNIDDHFFELDEEDNLTTGEQIRSAKTAQTSTVITVCYVCSKSDRPEVLLLCDSCDDAYHLECLRPILLSVPDNDWFCPLCEHKQLSGCLMEKFQELVTNYQRMEMKRIAKRSLQRNVRPKEYSSDESVTASESELETISQVNETSNLSSSSYMDENQSNISQRGRHRRTRFDMHKILNSHDDYNHYSDSNDDQQIADFDLQLPEKITRLLHRRNRNTEQQVKSLPTRVDHPSTDSNDPYELNEKLGSPLVYVTSDGQSRQMKSMITNSKQTLQIVRRWNDVQRRSRLKAINLKLSNPTLTSDYTDENSNLGLDDAPFPHSGNEFKIEDKTVNCSQINVVEPTTLIPFDIYSSRNMLQKVDANFDRLTRDIQFAVTEAHVLPTETKISDQQHVKRLQKKLFSPFTTKSPRSSLLPDVADATDNSTNQMMNT